MPLAATSSPSSLLAAASRTMTVNGLVMFFMARVEVGDIPPKKEFKTYLVRNFIFSLKKKKTKTFLSEIHCLCVLKFISSLV